MYLQKFLGLVCISLLSSCAILQAQPSLPLEVVPQVELTRYMGTWYEIATIPMAFQRDCTGTTATYTLNPDQSVTVLNRCRQKSLDGPLNQIEGRAWVPDGQIPAKLKVQFFWPFAGDYWIIDLDDNYQSAVVGHPSRNYLWILSRTPELAPEAYQSLLKKIQALGYDLERVVKTQQK